MKVQQPYSTVAASGLSYSDCLLAMTQRVHEEEETIIGEELGAHPMEREDDITPATKPVNAASSVVSDFFTSFL